MYVLPTKCKRIRGLEERYAYKWQQLFFMIAIYGGVFLPFEQFRKQFRMLLKHLPQLLKHIAADLCPKMLTAFGKESCVYLLGNQLPVCIKTVGIGIWIPQA